MEIWGLKKCKNCGKNIFPETFPGKCKYCDYLISPKERIMKEGEQPKKDNK